MAGKYKSVVLAFAAVLIGGAAEEGPAHARVFTAAVWVGEQCLASGRGTSKREAEQQAARAALEALADSDGQKAESEKRKGEEL